MEHIHYIIHKANALFEPSIAKMVASILIASSSFLFGDIYHQALTAIVMLMVMDTILGVAAAYANNEVITSRRFANSVVKGIVYFTAISASYFADITIPYNFIQSTMIGFVGITEFISILENIGRLGYKTPKKLLNQLHSEYVNKCTTIP